MLKRRKGSLTVEAVLILPIFMATILFISYFVKAHYVQDIVQDALTEAVMDVSAVSYPYYLSGALEFRNDIQEGTDSRREKLKQDFESVAELIEHVQNTGEAVKNKDFGGTIDNASGTIESVKTAKDAIEGVSPTEIFSFGKYYVANKGINVAENFFARKLILGSMGNTLSVDGKNIVDRMNALGIEGGLDGFDFKGSVFYGEDDVIDVQVQYKLSKVDPFGFIKGVTLKNRVVCRAWMGGVDIDGDGGIKRVTVPAKMVVGEEDPEKDVDRTFKTCYIIPSSKTSNRYHFHDCSSLREKGDSGKMKTVAAVQVPFVKTDGQWAPEGGSITYQGKAYTFCGNCAKGAFRADGEKAEEPPPSPVVKSEFELLPDHIKSNLNQYKREEIAGKSFNDQLQKFYQQQGIGEKEFKELIRRAVPEMVAEMEKEKDPVKKKLLQERLDKIKELRDSIDSPTQNTLMQKVIPLEKLEWNMKNTAVGGCMTKASDTKHLSTGSEIYRGLRLEYEGTPYGEVLKGKSDYCVIRFKPKNPSALSPVYCEALGGKETMKPPNYGSGFINSADGTGTVIPEYCEKVKDKYVDISDGSEIYQVDSKTGKEKIVAVFYKNKWVKVPLEE